ncbi:MAG: rRNA maturation RNase YbeY [Negativicutes bacterium]|nr:rRNA maturation RNase YbeY [Negativicutes bacterium]
METILSNVQEKIKITPRLKQTVTGVLDKAAEILAVGEQTEVSVIFVDDEYIRGLNLQYRGKDCATDVLSFALNEGDEPEVYDGPEETLLGDIVISLETAARQAEEFGHNLQRELSYLAVHGMLHLLGFDHETENDKTAMRLKEEQILGELGLSRAAETE